MKAKCSEWKEGDVWSGMRREDETGVESVGFGGRGGGISGVRGVREGKVRATCRARR